MITQLTSILSAFWYNSRIPRKDEEDDKMEVESDGDDDMSSVSLVNRIGIYISCR